ncbi:DUF1967 domain-containing protein, partial [Streptococcus sp. KR]
INKELEQYDERILKRPQIIVATKMDLPDAEDNLQEFKKRLNESQDSQTDVPEIFPISSVTHTGLTELIRKTADLLDTTKLSDLEKPQDTTKQYDYKPADSSDFHISYDKEYESWVITGDKIERLFKMTNTEHDQSMLRFA